MESGTQAAHDGHSIGLMEPVDRVGQPPAVDLAGMISVGRAHFLEQQPCPFDPIYDVIGGVVGARLLGELAADHAA